MGHVARMANRAHGGSVRTIHALRNHAYLRDQRTSHCAYCDDFSRRLPRDYGAALGERSHRDSHYLVLHGGDGMAGVRHSFHRNDDGYPRGWDVEASGERAELTCRGRMHYFGMAT